MRCKGCGAPIQTYEGEIDHLMALVDSPIPADEPIYVTERLIYRIDTRREDIKIEKRYGILRDLCHVCADMKEAAKTTYMDRLTKEETDRKARLLKNE